MGSPSILTNPMFNMGFLLVSMQLAKKVDWNDPQVVQYARFGFYGAQLLVIAMAYGLMSLIKKKNGKLQKENKERECVCVETGAVYIYVVRAGLR